MNKNIIIFILIVLNLSRGQTPEKSLTNLEHNLIVDFKKMLAADFDVRYDSLAPNFKKNLKTILSAPETFEYPFDSLGNYIKIIQSNDKRLRIFSWDERTGGTWHQIAGIAQFKNESGIVFSQYLATEAAEENDEIVDIFYYDIYDLKGKNSIYYLSFGWGTHGSGTHFKIIKAFKINGTEIVDDERIFKINNELNAVIFLLSTRLDPINLKFNQSTKILEFDELQIPKSFDEDKEYDIPRPTGNKIRLKFNGRFFEEMKLK